MDSTIVIKVKYGETLRRFSARVDEDGKLDLDMMALKQKVLGLFSFTPDADVTLTYVDEDGDVVTLVDEEDLHDVMSQDLNPLRITVKLNAEKGGKSYARSSGSSTPRRSAQFQHPLQKLNSFSEFQHPLQKLNSFSEVLKSVPEPLCDTLSKLSLDLVSKAASTAPGVAKLVDCLSKTGQSYLDSVSQFQAGAESNTQSGASGCTSKAPIFKDAEASKNAGDKSEVMPEAEPEEPTVKIDTQNVNKGIKTSVNLDPILLDLNDGHPGSVVPCGCPSTNPTSTASYINLKEEAVGLPAPNSVATNNSSIDANKPVENSSEPWQPMAGGAFTSYVGPMGHPLMDLKSIELGGDTRTKFPSGPGNNAVTQFALNPTNECPFTGTALFDSSVPPVQPLQCGPSAYPFKRSYNNGDGMDSIFHTGVRCDGCGVLPITGPRFKSKVKEDYDLCSICFAEMGNWADYIRMDHPTSLRHPYSFSGLHYPMHHSRFRPPTLPHVLRGGMKASRPKLDSRFIVDVNVLDGTVMAPLTPFTKIWRLRNDGTAVWPQGTQLAWIGGDKLSDALSFEVEIPVDGLLVGKELDIAVDFRAPELPGRYISYWRMASPSGQKFGQRVWVLIQVEASLNELFSDDFNALNLNLPPVSSGMPIVTFNEPWMEDCFSQPDNSSTDAQLVQPRADPPPIKEQEPSFSIHPSLLVGGSNSNPTPAEAPTSVSYPIIDLLEMAPVIVPSHAPSAPTDAPAPQRVGENNDVEQTLLRELEEMGFKEIDLNKEVLRMNEYDLEQSVDDLCGVGEWDPILEELQEMGFCDLEMNKKLLKKNNGSIKRVVMDLIAGQKA